MAKESVAQILNPLALQVQKRVHVEDGLAILRQLNYSAVNSPTEHGGAHCGEVGWSDGATDGRKGLGIVIDHAGLNAPEEVLAWPFYADADVVNLSFVAACYVTAGGTTIRVRFRVDTVQIGADMSFGTAQNGQGQVLAVPVQGGGGIGSGWHVATVEVFRSAGTSTTDQLVAAGLQDDLIDVTGLPDPTG